MSKTFKLVKNTAIIGMGTLSTKALTFFLLPLYTNVLNPDDYGLVDVLMTMSSLIIPFVAFEMNSGVFRFLIGTEDRKNYSNEEVVSTGIAIEAIGLIFALAVALIIYFFYNIPHFFAVVFYIVSLAFSKLALDTTRGFGDTVAYSIANIIITLVSLILNVVLILVFNWGAVAILIATGIGNFSGTIFLFAKERIIKYFHKSRVNKYAGRDMLKYTLPLIPNTVSWWIASASDRVIILWFLGAGANGIYAAAHKIPGVYTTLFTVFSLAWTESVARNASDSEFVETTVKRSASIMMYMLFGIMACTSLLFNVLIGEEYRSSYWHIFILLIAIFFSSLSSLYGGIFSGKMDSKNVAYTTVIGAVVNIIVNLGTVKFIGLYAASVSTTISYIVISIMRKSRIKSWYNIKLFDLKDLVFIPIGACVVTGYYFHNKYLNIISIFVIVTSFVISNRSLLASLIRKRLR